MDKNKLKVLQEVNYEIKKVCGMCCYMRAGTRAMWGTCTKFSYDHQKHTDTNREMSVHAFGSCSSFQLGADQVTWLGSFGQFLPKA